MAYRHLGGSQVQKGSFLFGIAQSTKTRGRPRDSEQRRQVDDTGFQHHTRRAQERQEELMKVTEEAEADGKTQGVPLVL